MVKHPLAESRFKVERARKHLNALKVGIGEYLASNPTETKSEPPLELSCMVGDCLWNLRTALDYAIWQVGVRQFSPGLVPGEAKLSFPFSETARNYHFYGRTSLERYGIPKEAIWAAESIQEYKPGCESMALLRRLRHEDMHQLHRLTVVGSETCTSFVAIQGPPRVPVEQSLQAILDLVVGAIQKLEEFV